MSSSEDDGGKAVSPSKDQVLAMYQELARKQRAKLQLKGKGKSKLSKRVVPAADDPREQLMLTVGRMVYSHDKGKSMIDRDFGTRKIVIHKQASYDRFLQRIKREVFPGGPENATYYIADSSGVAIMSGEIISVEDAAGNEQKLQWTLETFLKVSNIRYQSRAKFFCVKKTSVDEESDVEGELGNGHAVSDAQNDDNTATQEKEATTNVEKSGKAAKKVDNETIGKANTKKKDEVAAEKKDVRVRAHEEAVQSPVAMHVEMIEIDGVVCDESMETETVSEGRKGGEDGCIDEFQPLFLKVKQSLYSERYTFMTGLTQDTVLGFHIDDPDIMHDVQSDIVQNPSPGGGKIRPQNPCHFGFHLWGIRKGADTTIELVADLNANTGDVVLKKPDPGAQFSLWTAGFARDGVGVLVCIALDGFHAVSQYQWVQNDREMEDETYAVLYTSTCGECKCRVTVEEQNLHEGGVFSVTGEQGIQSVKMIQLQPIEQKDHICYKDFTELMELCTEQPDDISHELKLMNVIGQGSFGTVYKAFWRGTIVAAKVIPMPATTHERAQKEIDMCRTMQHPNILTVLGAVLSQTSLTVLTNLVRGCNLHTLIFDPGYVRMSFAAKLKIAVQIVQAMIYLRSAKPPMVHLDIKPANILSASELALSRTVVTCEDLELPCYPDSKICVQSEDTLMKNHDSEASLFITLAGFFGIENTMEGGVEDANMHAYLADFGLAKLITTSTSSVGSKSGQSGTPGFQSPELLKAEGVDVLADVYSFGCVLIELFGEKQVWCGLSHFQIMYKVGVELQPPEHDHLPEKIQSICASCIAQHDHRATAMQVLKALLQSAGV